MTAVNELNNAVSPDTKFVVLATASKPIVGGFPNPFNDQAVKIGVRTNHV